MDHLVTHARGQVYGERGRGQVSSARRLYERFRLFIHEMAKFGVVGGFAFIVTELFFNLFIHMGLDTFAANAGSTLVAAVVAFAGNRYWTFRHRERTGMGRETVVFFMLNGIGVLIQQVCIEIAKHELGRHDTVTVNAAFLVGVVLATLFRFWSYRKWVWRLAPPAVGEGPIEPIAAAAEEAEHLHGHDHVNGRAVDERIAVASGPGRHRAGRN
jgi:putative flippase GtrA